NLIKVEDSDEERVTKKPKIKKDDHLPRESKLSYDEKAKIIDIETPPTYLTFGLTNALKPNIQISQPQSQSTTTDTSNLISALHKYLELLTNALNSSTE
ncbi:30225_t:CDS:2, partial [Racocetra persica]